MHVLGLNIIVIMQTFSKWYILFHPQNHHFKYMGTLIAMSVVQGGIGFPVLAPHVYQYMASGDYLSICLPIEDIPDPQVRDLLSQVELAIYFRLHHCICVVSKCVCSVNFSSVQSNVHV